MNQISMDALEQRDLATFLFPTYADDREARALVAKDLLVLDPRAEEYVYTAEGERQHAIFRMRHAMTWLGSLPGGGRWIVQGRELHCGDALEVVRDDGTWMRVRFEVKFGEDRSDGRGGRIPLLFISLGGGSSLRCEFEIESASFRLPPR